MEAFEGFDEFAVFLLAFDARGINFAQDFTDGVHHLEKNVGDSRIQKEFTGAHLGEQAFAGVAEGFEFCEAEKAAAALNRVNGAEDAVEQLGVLRIGFQLYKFLVQAVEIFGAFENEIFD